MSLKNILLISILTLSTAMLPNNGKLEEQQVIQLNFPIISSINRHRKKEVMDYFTTNPSYLLAKDPKSHRTALELAARALSPELLEALLNLYAKEGKLTQELLGNALLEAVKSDNKRMVKILLDRRAPLNAITIEGKTPLMLTNTPIIAFELLLRSSKDDLTARDLDDKTAYQLALEASNNPKKGHNEQTNYHKIALDIKSAAFRLGVPLGDLVGSIQAPTNVVDAIKGDDKNSMQTLIQYLDNCENACVNAVDEDDMPLLILAILDNKTDIANLLLRNGANVNFAHLTSGYTPLMAAAFIGNLNLVEFLVASGAIIDATNEDGATAADIAMRQHKLEAAGKASKKAEYGAIEKFLQATKLSRKK